MMILALAALTLAGCGGGGGSSSSTTADAGPTTTETGAAPSQTGGNTHKRPDDPLSTLEGELEAAGYGVTPAEPTGAQGGLEARAPGGATIQIAYYQDPERAAGVGRQIEGIFSRHPGQGVVEVRGGFLIDLAQEHRLAKSEEEAVEEVAELAGRAG
jgi:hypothetical protein